MIFTNSLRMSQPSETGVSIGSINAIGGERVENDVDELNEGFIHHHLLVPVFSQVVFGSWQLLTSSNNLGTLSNHDRSL